MKNLNSFLFVFLLITQSFISNAQTIEASYTIEKGKPVPAQIAYSPGNNSTVTFDILRVKKELQISITCYDSDLKYKWNKLVYAYDAKNSTAPYGSIAGNHYLAISSTHIYFFRNRNKPKGGTEVLLYTYDLDGNSIGEVKPIIDEPQADMVKFIASKSSNHLTIIPRKISAAYKSNKKLAYTYSSLGTKGSFLELPQKNNLTSYTFNTDDGQLSKEVFDLNITGNGGAAYFNLEGQNKLHFMFLVNGTTAYIVQCDRVTKNVSSIKVGEYTPMQFVVAVSEFDKYVFQKDYFIQSGVITQSPYEKYDPKKEEALNPVTLYFKKRYFGSEESTDKNISTPVETIAQIKGIAETHKIHKKELLDNFEYVDIIPKNDDGVLIIAERNRDESTSSSVTTYSKKAGSGMQHNTTETNVSRYFADEFLVYSLNGKGDLEWVQVIDKQHRWHGTAKPIPYTVKSNNKLYLFYNEDKKKSEGGNNVFAATLDDKGNLVSRGPVFTEFSSNAFFQPDQCFQLTDDEIILWVSNFKTGNTLYKVRLD